MSLSALLDPAHKAVDLPATEAFADLRAHMARLDLPEGQAVDWAHVEREATTLLRCEGKDLLLAAYAAFAPLALGRDESPHTAIDFVRSFAETFWASMTPPVSRPRARANCFAWFFTRLCAFLKDQTTQLNETQNQHVRASLTALSDMLTQHLAAHAPSPVAVLRLLATHHASQAQRHRDAVSTASTPSRLPRRVNSAQAQATPQQTPQDCQMQARALCLLAQSMRRADPMDTQACRLWRVGLWLNVHTAPAVVGDKTRIAPLGPTLVAELAALRRAHNWQSLYELAEQSMFAAPLSLDLQFYAALGLRHMAAPSPALAEVVQRETQALCCRIPSLPNLRAADGSMLAMSETRDWLALKPQSVIDTTLPTSLGSATKSRTHRRFVKRLNQAADWLAAGHIDAAEALYTMLQHDVRRHVLTVWAPEWAARVADGHLAALRLQKPCDLPRLRRAYRRWAQLQPERARLVRLVDEGLETLQQSGPG